MTAGRRGSPAGERVGSVSRGVAAGGDVLDLTSLGDAECAALGDLSMINCESARKPSARGASYRSTFARSMDAPLPRPGPLLNRVPALRRKRPGGRPARRHPAPEQPWAANPACPRRPVGEASMAVRRLQHLLGLDFSVRTLGAIGAGPVARPAPSVVPPCRPVLARAATRRGPTTWGPGQAGACTESTHGVAMSAPESAQGVRVTILALPSHPAWVIYGMFDSVHVRWTRLGLHRGWHAWSPGDEPALPRAPLRCCSRRPACSTGHEATTHWASRSYSKPRAARPIAPVRGHTPPVEEAKQMLKPWNGPSRPSPTRSASSDAGFFARLFQRKVSPTPVGSLEALQCNETRFGRGPLSRGGRASILRDYESRPVQTRRCPRKLKSP